jgi:hypothetical protein
LILFELIEALARRKKPHKILAPIQQRVVGGLDDIVTKLLNCSISIGNNQTNSSASLNTTAYRYVWNKLPYTLRFLLLNQTSMKTMENWDAMAVLSAAQQRSNKLQLIKWQSLPSNVSIRLLEQAKSNSYFNMTFGQWGWVSLNDANANVTLLPVMTDECVSIVPRVIEILSRITFDLVVNGSCRAPGKHRHFFKNHNRKGWKKERSTSSISSSSESASDSESKELGKWVMKMQVKACLVRHGFMRVFSDRMRKQNTAARIVEDAFLRAERFFR